MWIENENSCTFSLTLKMGRYNCQLDNKYDLYLSSLFNPIDDTTDTILSPS